MSKLDDFIKEKKVLFHAEIKASDFNLTEEKALLQDMPSEYAVIDDLNADGGVIVYAKFNGEWKVNPWSTRFLVRTLIHKLNEQTR
jgi:hypothetical protein